MQILVLGSNGLLGSEFRELLDKNAKFNTSFSSRKELDVTDKAELEKQIKQWSNTNNQKVVINCTAYTNVDKAETDQDLAFQINRDTSAHLAELSVKHKFKLIHFSTDYVFNGEKKSGYNENDKRDPINIYGKSKAEGEIAALKNAPNNIAIIRTAWLYGKYGNNFVDTMIRLSKDRDQLSVVNDQFGSPTSAKDLARFILNNFLEQKEFPIGVFHLTNSSSSSWYQLAEKTFEIKNIKIKLEKTTSEQFKRAAKRPKYSILNNNKLPKMPNWQVSLKSYLTD